MRAFYCTQRGTRFFVLGTPEGWHILTLNLKTGEWRSGGVHKTLKEAKVAVEATATELLGKKPAEVKWH
jgi:hypothetical protein